MTGGEQAPSLIDVVHLHDWSKRNDGRRLKIKISKIKIILTFSYFH